MSEISVSPALLLVVLIECIAVSWFYGTETLTCRGNLWINACFSRCQSIFIWYQSNDWFETIVVLESDLVFDQSIVSCGRWLEKTLITKKSILFSKNYRLSFIMQWNIFSLVKLEWRNTNSMIYPWMWKSSHIWWYSCRYYVYRVMRSIN